MSGHLSRILSEHADRQKRLHHVLRSVNFIVGVVVVLLTLLALVPAFDVLAETNIVTVTALIAALALLADAVLPSILSEPNPERFKDYALYIRSYAQELVALESDVDLPDATWRARAQEVIRLGRMNFDDAFRQWPWLVQKVKDCSCSEYWEENVG